MNNNNDEEYGISVVLNLAKASMSNIANQVKMWAKQVKQDASVSVDYKLSASEAQYNIEQLKAHIDDATETIKYYNDLLNDSSQSTYNKNMYLELLQQEQARLTALTSKYDELTGEAQELGNSLDEVGSKAGKAGREIDKSFSSSIKTGRRFLFSLFSIRSIYSLISRASSTYLSENNKLNNSVQLTSSLIGNTLAPVIKKIVDYSQYAVIGISELIRLFTGYDAVGKAVANANNNIAKSAKSATKASESLASIDTIQNLSDSADSGFDAGSINDSIDALNDFKKKVDEVRQIFEKYETPIKVATGLLATLFGASMLSKIGAIIGTSAGLTGLTGVQTLLTGLATVGTIYLAVVATKAVIDTIKQLKELKGLQQDIIDQKDKLMEKSKEITDKYIQESNAGNLSAETQKSIIKVQEDKITGMKHEIETAKEQLRIMGDGIFVGHQYKESLLKTIEQSKRYSDELINMANATNLTDTEQQELINTLTKNIENAEKGREGLKKYSKEYQTAGTYIDSMKSSLEKLTGKKYNTSLKVDIGADTSSAERSTNSWISKLKSSLLSGIGNTLSKINLGSLAKNLLHFDVGTTYVPDDTLAVVHKGEQIIPKKWNPATSGIYNSSPEVVSKLDELIDVLENKDMNAYISRNEVGRNSASYVKEQSRIMNRNGA